MRLSFALLLAAAACDAEDHADDETASERTPGGKNDGVLMGSCEQSCGGASMSGNCWCDDQCHEYADCCDDREAVCEAPDGLLPPSQEQIDALLLLVNTASPEFLQTEVGVSEPVARAIVARRRGPDGSELTEDDAPFTSLGEVDALAGVGQFEITTMGTFAYPLPALDKYLPASFDLRMPALTCKTVNCTPSEPITVWHEVYIYDTELAFGSLPGRPKLKTDGSFEMHESFTSCGPRNCHWGSAQVEGYFSPFGSVTITAYKTYSKYGNQALGFQYDRTELVGPHRVFLDGAEN